MAPSPVKISHKKYGHIDFMFFGNSYPAAGSNAVDTGTLNTTLFVTLSLVFQAYSCEFFRK